MKPYAYLRKSRVFRDKRAVSPEMQLAEVTALAARHGHDGLVVLEDMGISGKKGRSGRPGFAKLLAAVEAGQVSAIYSYSLSRLSRSMRDVLELAELAGAKGVPIHLCVDPDPDPTSPSGKLILTILAAMAQFEADVASERARDTVDQRRARGEKLGPAFYENPQVVAQAYAEAGSIIGAARLLTAQGVPTSKGRSTLWQPTSVREILGRLDLLPVGKSRGAKKAAPFLFYRLLRCRCGKLLTGVRFTSGKQAGYVVYRCLQGRVDPQHGPQSVPETTVLAWAREEAALMSPPDPEYQLGEDVADKRKALLDRRQRIGRAFVDETIDAEAYELELAAIRDELELLDRAGRTVTLEPIVWDREPQLVNAALRALWSEVEMDEEQRPARAEWTMKSWRRTPGA